MVSMFVTIWFVIIGVLFIAMALSGSVLKRLPLTTAMLYMLVGFLLGISGTGLLRVDLLEHVELLEVLTEVAVLISLFSAGLKLRTPLRDGRWRLPVRLASISMMVTVGLVTVAGVTLLGLPVGAAVLLGAVLAPTDPVLASDVQVENPHDRDRLRFSLTGEAGLNDGSAFPFVMLGLGLLGLHELGSFGWRWLVVDVIWAVSGGLLIGGLLGTLVGRLVLHLRREHREAIGLDDFLALGLIALAYGVALLLHTYGFLAVFAAGLALRQIERRESGDRPPEEVAQAARAGATDEIATSRETAPAYMAQAVLGFNEQLERIAEVALVLVLGGLLASSDFPLTALLFVPLLLLVIRPLSVAFGLLGARVTTVQRRMIGWFGLRGIGSLYYLCYAINHGLPEPLARELAGLTLATVAVSIVVHGISVTPLMHRYSQLRERRRGEGAQRSAS
ncbi:MAG: cation:proton antiporter [Roseiflexaceae bacterium]